jgi:hypothetical protein
MWDFGTHSDLKIPQTAFAGPVNLRILFLPGEVFLLLAKLSDILREIKNEPELFNTVNALTLMEKEFLK